MNHEFRFTDKKIARRIDAVQEHMYRKQEEISPFFLQELASPLDVSFQNADVNDGDWEEIEPYSYWGRSRTDFVLRSSFSIPEDWDPQLPVALYLPLGEPGSFSHPEALIYVDGEAYSTADRHHQEVLLKDEWRDGNLHTLTLHGWTGNSNRGGEMAKLFMKPCSVVQIDPLTKQFVALARVSLGVVEYLEPHDPVRIGLLNGLDEAFKQVDLRNPIGDAFYRSITTAYATLKSAVEKSGSPLPAQIIAAGHAHIDVAWLWTLGQTRRKAGRTFYNVIRFMEEFPEYCFTQSQPQLYDFVREDYPELFEQIKDRVDDGRWELIGGMWIEADCNLSGGESLARQFLLGRRFFRKHFGMGVESPVLWLPDVFGYAWNLPQMIKEAGMEYFFTIKIGWNQYNKMPYDSFWWQGLDGTKVLTHFSTTPESHDMNSRATYNAFPTAGTVIHTWRNFQQMEVQDKVLMSYGWGDGGGGPNREMLENIRVMNHFPAVPKIRTGKVLEYFRTVEAEHGDDLPTWNGELYLEYHRGTYTTHAGNKRANRKSEFLLHDAEFVAALADLVDDEYNYPTDIFEEAWELVCLNQFHDILPGSSITDVYTESMQQYAEIKDAIEFEREKALEALMKHCPGDILVVNPTGFTRNDVVFWRGDAIRADHTLELPQGATAITQSSSEGTYIALQNIPPYSVIPLKSKPGTPTRASAGVHASESALKNSYIEVYFNTDGDIIRIFDVKNQREVLPEGKIANQFIAFEDRPLNWDAWDIDVFYEDKSWLADPATSIEVLEFGPLRGTLEIRRRILNSDVTQRISIDYNSPAIHFDTIVEWNERQILLKTAFPVDVLSPRATYEVQWGNVERPTHKNTSWDWARFETAAQKWVDLSQGDYGVSLMNDCKYGHDIHDNVMRLSLLRGTTGPDPHADEGMHRFAYTLLPHAGNWNAETIRQAYMLNDPIVLFGGSKDGSAHTLLNQPLVQSDSDSIVIETVKAAEDGRGLIVRFYEALRSRKAVTLTTSFKVAEAYRTNFIEDDGKKLDVSNADNGGSSVTYTTRPYEIVTLRFIPA